MFSFWPFNGGVVLGENPRASEHDKDRADESDRGADSKYVQSQGQVHLQASSSWTGRESSRLGLRLKLQTYCTARPFPPSLFRLNYLNRFIKNPWIGPNYASARLPVPAYSLGIYNLEG